MKIFLYCLFVTLFFPINNIMSQCYTVLTVKGEILLEKTGQPIKEMDEVCSTDKIIFSTPDSKAAVLSPDKGRFVIKTEKETGKNNAIKEFVSNVLFAGKERLSSKIIFFDEKQELKNSRILKEEFGSNYYIINESRFFIDSATYRIKNNDYFFIMFPYEGKDVVKNLKYEKEILIINKEIFTGYENLLKPDKISLVNLYYYDSKNNEKKNLFNFNISFLDEERLRAEVTNYISILQKEGKSNYVITQEVISLINDLYGNINYYDAEKWLGENLK